MMTVNSNDSARALCNILDTLPHAGGIREGQLLHDTPRIQPNDLPRFVRTEVVVIGPVSEACYIHIYGLGIPNDGKPIVLAHVSMRMSLADWPKKVDEFFHKICADYIVCGPEIAFGLATLGIGPLKPFDFVYVIGGPYGN